MDNRTSPLDTISIAKPCSADWSAMTGTERVRFCGQCNLNVYNLSEMSRPAAEELVRESEGRVCVRYHMRADGTMLTQDCPVGVRAVQQRMMRRVRSVVAAVATLVAGVTGHSELVAKRYPMGRPARPTPPPTAIAVAVADTSMRADTLVQIELPTEMPEYTVMGGIGAAPRMEQVEMTYPDTTAVIEEVPVEESDLVVDPDETGPAVDPDESEPVVDPDEAEPVVDPDDSQNYFMGEIAWVEPDADGDDEKFVAPDEAIEPESAITPDDAITGGDMIEPDVVTEPDDVIEFVDAVSDANGDLR